jgi:hypothetical protein
VRESLVAIWIERGARRRPGSLLAVDVSRETLGQPETHVDAGDRLSAQVSKSQPVAIDVSGGSRVSRSARNVRAVLRERNSM